MIVFDVIKKLFICCATALIVLLIFMMKNKKNKVGRNQPCTCGSGLKYKKCCSGKKMPDNSDYTDIKKIYRKKYDIRFKNKQDVDAIKRAGRLAIDTLLLAESELRPGITTNMLNDMIHEFTLKNNARPAPLNYRGFPKSVCLSVNDAICHGIPGNRILNEGDIINIDVTPILDGYYADVSKTYFVGRPGKDALKIVNVAKECLRKGLSMVNPKNCVGDIGWAIQRHAENEGCSVVREFVGHGVGFEFHEPPQILHYGQRKSGIKLVPGMVFTIEPMINLGKRDLHILENGWTAVTDDGSLSAQFEQTILVTDTGFESLTPYEL